MSFPDRGFFFSPLHPSFDTSLFAQKENLAVLEAMLRWLQLAARHSRIRLVWKLASELFACAPLLKFLSISACAAQLRADSTTQAYKAAHACNACNTLPGIVFGLQQGPRRLESLVDLPGNLGPSELGPRLSISTDCLGQPQPPRGSFQLARRTIFQFGRFRATELTFVGPRHSFTSRSLCCVGRRITFHRSHGPQPIRACPCWRYRPPIPSHSEIFAASPLPPKAPYACVLAYSVPFDFAQTPLPNGEPLGPCCCITGILNRSFGAHCGV